MITLVRARKHPVKTEMRCAAFGHPFRDCPPPAEIVSGERCWRTPLWANTERPGKAAICSSGDLPICFTCPDAIRELGQLSGSDGPAKTVAARLEADLAARRA